MTPGPTLVLQCPTCPTQVSHMTTAPGPLGQSLSICSPDQIPF